MRKNIAFYKDLHLTLMKAILFSLCILFSLTSRAATLEYGHFFTYHFIAAGYFNSADRHTTFNPNLRLTVENLSITLLRDSIGDYNVGVIYRLPLGELPVKLILGGYTVTPSNWKKKDFKKVWLDLPAKNLGFIPVLGPGIELDLFKKENFKIKVEGFASAGLFVTGGLTFGWDF